MFSLLLRKENETPQCTFLKMYCWICTVNSEAKACVFDSKRNSILKASAKLTLILICPRRQGIKFISRLKEDGPNKQWLINSGHDLSPSGTEKQAVNGSERTGLRWCAACQQYQHSSCVTLHKPGSSSGHKRSSPSFSEDSWPTCFHENKLSLTLKSTCGMQAKTMFFPSTLNVDVFVWESVLLWVLCISTCVSVKCCESHKIRCQCSFSNYLLK